MRNIRINLRSSCVTIVYKRVCRLTLYPKTKKPPVSRTPLVASTKPEATHSTKPHKTTTTLDCEEKKFGKTVQQATAHATKHQFQQPYTLETVR